MTSMARLDPPVARPEQINFSGFEISSADTFVDVGSGDGLVCAYAGWQGADVIGLDIDPDCVRLTDEAMRKVPARSYRGIQSDCDPIPLPGQIASVVVCTEVLEHVESPERIARELVRIGRPGARYLISVPDPAAESLMKIVAGSWYWQPPYHRRVFEHDQLDGLLTTAGLEIIRREGSGFYWALRWAFIMALGAQPGDPMPDSPLLDHWDQTWKALGNIPAAERLANGLNQLIPKSQVILARKPLD